MRTFTVCKALLEFCLEKFPYVSLIKDEQKRDVDYGSSSTDFVIILPTGFGRRK